METKNLALLTVLILLAAGVSGFDFYGYTYNTNKQPLANTNVTVVIYDFSNQMSVVSTRSVLSNASGFFNVTNLSGGLTYGYGASAKHFNGSNADYVGKSLPPFPYMEFSTLTPPINFYLWQGATINFSVFKDSMGQLNFSYQVKDTKLGYSVDQLFTSRINQKTVYVPANRNYSIMFYPDMSFPFSYELNNLSAYSNPIRLDLNLNASETLIWVSGYAKFNGSAGFDSFDVLGYIVEPGNMVYPGMAIPCNISSWRMTGLPPTPANLSDQFNPTTGFFNMTLIGSSLGAKTLLFAVAKVGSNYYGAFRNITLSSTTNDVADFNFTLLPLMGSVVENVSCQLMNMFGPPGTKNVEVKKVLFVFQNASGDRASNVHTEVSMDYSSLGSATFSWMTDADQNSNGTIKLPMLSSNVSMDVFAGTGAPLSTTVTASQLSASQVNITTRAFRPGGIEGEVFTDLYLDMLVNNATCDVPYPPLGCSLIPPVNMSEFNPLSIVMGGGDLSFRMSKRSNNITVHYKRVDLLASGPPDALFDSSANSSSNATAMEEAWRFGSTGPEIYDSILMGMPYTGIDDVGNITVLIGKLYDNDWNVVWNSDNNTIAELPAAYSDFNTQWFNVSSSGMPCDKTNQSALCYADTTNDLVWLTIPHFSGLGPELKGPPRSLSTSNIPLKLGWNLISLPLAV